MPKVILQVFEWVERRIRSGKGCLKALVPVDALLENLLVRVDLVQYGISVKTFTGSEDAHCKVGTNSFDELLKAWSQEDSDFNQTFFVSE